MANIVTQPVDSGILHEIVRVIDARSKVPERVRLRGREYLITYLEDHKQRLEEALRRRDSDRISMLYGQLASKVKYQMLRARPAAQGRTHELDTKRAAAAKKAVPAVKQQETAKKTAKKTEKKTEKKTVKKTVKKPVKKAVKKAVKKSPVKSAGAKKRPARAARR